MDQNWRCDCQNRRQIYQVVHRRKKIMTKLKFLQRLPTADFKISDIKYFEICFTESNFCKRQVEFSFIMITIDYDITYISCGMSNKGPTGFIPSGIVSKISPRVSFFLVSVMAFASSLAGVRQEVGRSKTGISSTSISANFRAGPPPVAAAWHLASLSCHSQSLSIRSGQNYSTSMYRRSDMVFSANLSLL